MTWGVTGGMSGDGLRIGGCLAIAGAKGEAAGTPSAKVRA